MDAEVFGFVLLGCFVSSTQYVQALVATIFHNNLLKLSMATWYRVSSNVTSVFMPLLASKLVYSAMQSNA